MKNLDELDSEAPILKSIADLYKEFYLYLKIFPKKDQYLLGKRCEEYLLSFMEAVLLAAGLQRENKLRILEQANSRFDVLKVLVRMARELKMLDNKKYLSIGTKMQEIGRMLGGWMRSLR